MKPARLGVLLTEDHLTPRPPTPHTDLVGFSTSPGDLSSMGLELHGAGRLAQSLERAREKGRCGVGVVHPNPQAALLDSLSEGRLDGRLLLAPPPQGPRVWVRGDCEVLDLLAGAAWEEVPTAAEGLVEGGWWEEFDQVREALGWTGVDWGVAELPGVKAVALLVKEAQRRGWRLSGPFTDAVLITKRLKGVVALTPAHVEWPLAVWGDGETHGAWWIEGALTVWGRPDSGTWWGAADWAGRTLLRTGFARAAAREPSLSLVSRPSRSAPAHQCPYCQEPLLCWPDQDGRGGWGSPLVCEGCGTAHHRGCVMENGRCTVLGCDSEYAQRGGTIVPYAGLGQGDALVRAFERERGDVGEGPGWVRLEPPADDPRARLRSKAVRLELPQEVTRGSFLEGWITIETARELRVHRATLWVEAELETEDDAEPARRRVECIVRRRALLWGNPSNDPWGRLRAGLAALWGEGGVEVPQGIRRYAFGIRLPASHPATVAHTGEQGRETVRTRLRVEVDGLHASAEVTVR